MATDRVDRTVEGDRRELSVELSVENGPEWETPYKPGTFGCHELLDRVAFLSKSLDEFVVEHPACIRNADWYALARQASDALAELYQRVGSEHL